MTAGVPAGLKSGDSFPIRISLPAENAPPLRPKRATAPNKPAEEEQPILTPSIAWANAALGLENEGSLPEQLGSDDDPAALQELTWAEIGRAHV